MFVRLGPKERRFSERQSLQAIQPDECEWESMYQEAAKPEPLPLPVFAHIGHINLKTWHFGLKRLECVDESAKGSAESRDRPAFLLQPLDPAECGERLGIYSDVEMFAYVLDLKLPWTLSFFAISGHEPHWTALPDATVPVIPIKGVQEFLVWQGSAAEAMRRERPSTLPEHGGRDRGARRPRGPRGPRARQEVAQRNTARRSVRREAKSKSQVEHPALEDDPFLQSDDSAGDNGGAAGDALSENDPYGVDGSEVFVQSDHEVSLQADAEEADGEVAVSPVASSEASEDPFADDWMHPAQAAGSNEKPSPERPATPDLMPPPSSSSQPDISLEALAPPVPVPPAPPAPARAARAARAGASRSTLNVTVMQVEDHGEIHYHHISGLMQAFCRHPGHEPDCRKGATTEPKGRASGRPLGLLVSWLLQRDAYNSKAEHAHSFRQTYAARVEAREYFKTLPDSERFLGYEKQRRGRSPEEPERV